MTKKYENESVVICDNDTLKDRENIIIYKEGNDYIIRKDNIFTISDYKDMIYSVFISNRKNNNIYFVGMDDEEVEKISKIGKSKRDFKLRLEDIENDPEYEDADRKIKTRFFIDENILDILYTVSDEELTEEFRLKMDIIYDTKIEYQEGKILNPEYMSNVKEQLQEKLHTDIELIDLTKQKVKAL